MNLLIGMTTANRYPRTNYVSRTLKALHKQGVRNDRLHVFVGGEVKWFQQAVKGFDDVCILHASKKYLNRNENGVFMVTGVPKCDWVLFLEDDLAFCDDFVQSVENWLTIHARENRRLYSFFSRHGRPVGDVQSYDYCPCKPALGFLAMAMRWEDAQKFGAWAQNRMKTWKRKNGFDELLRFWLRAQYPGTKILCAKPCFVQHTGDDSLAHPGKARRITPHFAGERWRYPSSVASGGTPNEAEL
jgi:hypothetical protein